jgi:hypothetical protein
VRWFVTEATQKMLKFMNFTGSLAGVSAFMLIASLLAWTGNAYAQSSEKESVAIVELGGAAERSFTEGNSSFGPTVGGRGYAD